MRVWTGSCHRERPQGRVAIRQVHGGIASGASALAMTTLLLSACSSPEAARTRGGGAGADVRNWGHPVELHAGAQPYHKTPCVTEPVECNGPPPVFGPTPPPD
jgi:hypothetical protein